MFNKKDLVYLRYLLEQYRNATGNKISVDNLFKEISKGNSSLLEDFQIWLADRQMHGDSYAKWLKLGTSLYTFSPFFDTDIFSRRECVEVGRGKYDTLVADTNNAVISPYTRDFKRNMARPLMNGKLIVLNGKPIFASENGNVTTLDQFTN